MYLRVSQTDFLKSFSSAIGYLQSHNKTKIIHLLYTNENISMKPMIIDDKTQPAFPIKCRLHSDQFKYTLYAHNHYGHTDNKIAIR